MIIVSDTSPINNLAAINQLHLLHQLYGTVLIPDAVYRELSDPNFPVAGATEVQTLNWIQTRAVSDRTLVEAKQNLQIKKLKSLFQNFQNLMKPNIFCNQKATKKNYWKLLTMLSSIKI